MLGVVRIQLPGPFPLRQATLQVDGFDDTSTLVLDARFLWWAGPLELAAIVAMGTDAAHQGRKVELLLPHDDDVKSYLSRMDVIERLAPFAKVDDAPARQRRNDRSSTLLEVTDVTSSNADLVAAQLGRMAKAEFGLRTGSAAFKCLAELIGNATTHGVGDIPAFTAAQLYTGAKSRQPRGFEFAVCDTGVGILEHLRASVHHQNLTDSQDALERAMNNGITGGPEGRGCGLGNLRDHASRDGGKLTLRSGNAIADIVLRGVRSIVYRSVATPIEGTWASLRVRVS